MPFLTDRAQQLQDLRGQIALHVLSHPELSYSSDTSTSDSNTSFSDEESTTSSDLDNDYLKVQDRTCELCELYVLVDNQRYFEDRGKFLKSKEFADLYFQELPRSYFRYVTRMEKDSFWSLVRLIKNDLIFQNESPRDQMSVSLQLATTLDRPGHYGNGSALKRSGILWRVSTGSIIQFMHRCLLALECALANVVQWPDQNDRSRISNEFAKMGFWGCVGLLDGTTLPLSQRPKIDGEVYFDRKKHYSLNMQVVCDDKKKITHIYTGMPGSCSDILCFQNSPLYRHIDNPRTFSNGEYLLSDNGYLGQK